MSWAITATVGVTAYGAMNQYAAGSASAAYSKKQAAYNDKMNAKRAREQGIAIDTNTLRARTEATVALDAIENQSNEAQAQARVAGAAMGIGAGSYDTVLNTFAKKTNQAEGSTIQSLVSELVNNKLQRQQVADQATTGQSTGTQAGPSAMGAILGGVANYFSSTNGLAQAFGGGSSSAHAATQEISNNFMQSAGMSAGFD
jgi:hypothetical protein